MTTRSITPAGYQVQTYLCLYFFGGQTRLQGFAYSSESLTTSNHGAYDDLHRMARLFIFFLRFLLFLFLKLYSSFHSIFIRFLICPTQNNIPQVQPHKQLVMREKDFL